MLVSLGALGCGAEGRTAPTADAVVRSEVEPCRGGPVGRATGFAVSTSGIVTVAHALDDARSFTVLDASGRERNAELVHRDDELDVAVLRLDDPMAGPLSLGPSVRRGDATVLSTGAVDGIRSQDVVVRRRARVSLDGGLRRRAIEIEADIVPGDSGGPVVVDDAAVAMVFATSRRDARGWALDATELARALRATDVASTVALSCD